MFCPDVAARRIKADNFPSLRIDGSKIASLGPVAEKTGPGKIFSRGLTTMLYGDDVIRLVGQERIILVEQAVLAVLPSPLTHLATKLHGNVLAHRGGIDLFWFARMRALTSRMSSSACSN
jgi:hypothetical protein